MDETTTNPNAQHEVNRIKDDIQKLRDDLTSLVNDFTSFSRDRLTDTRNRFSAAVGAFRGRATGQVQDTKETVRRESREAIETSRAAIREKPLTYAAAAFGAGMLFSATRRHSHKRRW